MSLIKRVLESSDKIQNGRDVYHPFIWAKGEMDELCEELVKKTSDREPGPDGIMGEAIDVIQCMIDVIRLTYPEFTHEELIEQMTSRMATKCDKWESKYATAESISG